MIFDNYTSISLRDSAVDGASSGQSSEVTIPETVSQAWVAVNKTAENNADNLLTVRVQAKIGTIWVDVPNAWQQTATVTVAADWARQAYSPNLVEEISAAPPQFFIGKLLYIPSNTLRAAFVSSGTGSGGVDTGTMNTFSVILYYRLYEFGS